MLRYAWILATGLLFLVSSPAVAQYRTYTQIGQILQAAEASYPSFCERHDLGLSYQGRHIWALRITDNLGVQEDEPEIKLVSTMHGDEWIGNEMCLHLIDYITTHYGTDPRITNIVDNADLWIVPLMNPDGYDRASPDRENAQGYDLNRNFPDWYTSPNNTPTGRPTEVGVIMNWSFDHSFILAANMHTGSLVVNYPFDNDNLGSVFSPSPDEDLFVWMSESYSQSNVPMWNSGSFYHGITNGADWYSIDGGMQDWNYRFMGCNAVTLELSNTKIPSSSLIPDFWDDNRESLLAYIETAFVGVRGLVTDESSGLPLAATVRVVGRDHDVYTDPDVGDYHRMLLPGTYGLTIEADAGGYDTVTCEDVLVGSGDATRFDVALGAPVEVDQPDGGEVLAVGAATTVSWVGSASQSFQVQYATDPLGTTTEEFDFESGVLDGRFALDGPAPWYVTSGTAHGGSYSVRAGGITHGETTSLTLTADGGPVAFWYRVSSESGWDFFRFFVDGDQMFDASGNVGWTEYTTTLPAGTHELEWRYTKDVNTSSGSDTVWVDDISVTLETAEWFDIVAQTSPGATSVPWTPTVETDGCMVRVRTLYGSNGYGLWDSSDAVFSVVAPMATGDADDDGDVDMRDYYELLNCMGDSPTGPCLSVFNFAPAQTIDLSDYSLYFDEITGPIAP